MAIKEIFDPERLNTPQQASRFIRALQDNDTYRDNILSMNAQLNVVVNYSQRMGEDICYLDRSQRRISPNVEPAVERFYRTYHDRPELLLQALIQASVNAISQLETGAEIISGIKSKNFGSRGALFLSLCKVVEGADKSTHRPWEPGQVLHSLNLSSRDFPTLLFGRKEELYLHPEQGNVRDAVRIAVDPYVGLAKISQRALLMGARSEEVRDTSVKYLEQAKKTSAEIDIPAALANQRELERLDREIQKRRTEAERAAKKALVLSTVGIGRTSSEELADTLRAGQNTGEAANQLKSLILDRTKVYDLVAYQLGLSTRSAGLVVAGTGMSRLSDTLRQIGDLGEMSASLALGRVIFEAAHRAALALWALGKFSITGELDPNELEDMRKQIFERDQNIGNSTELR